MFDPKQPLRRLALMDREAEYDAKQPEDSFAGLFVGILERDDLGAFVGILLLFLVGAGLVVLFSLLPI